MSEPKFISVCIPAYNQTVFLQRTLDSIASQTFRDFEVIISDDSSNDNVKTLAMTFSRQFQLTYHRNERSLGSPANWNKAMELASGKYIKIMHHDDWFNSPDALQLFATNANQDPGCSLFFCVSKILNVQEQTLSWNAPDDILRKQLSEDPHVLFNHNFIGAPSAVMFRNNGQRFDERLKYLVDVEFYIRLLKGNKHFKYLNQPLIVNTSNHSGQVTAESQGREIQVGEYCYLYNKVFNGKIPTRELALFFMTLFSIHNIKRISEIADFGYPAPMPQWYFRLIILLGRLKK